MNLSFKPTGELDSGTFTAPGEKPETLDGSANSGFGEIYLELESKTYGFFEGLLTFESNSGANLAVTGKLHLAKSEAAKQLLGPRVRGARVQDDPPWIITKP